MLTNYFLSSSTLERFRSGLAAPFLEGFAESLKKAGYSRQTIRAHLSVGAHLGHWGQDKGISTREWDEEVGRTFQHHLATCKCPLHPGKYDSHAAAAIRLFLSYLRQVSALATPMVGEKKRQELPLLRDFRQWMGQHRGVREATLHYYSLVIRDLVNSVEGQPARLTVDRIRSFVLKQTRELGRHPKQVTTSVRMFVRYLSVAGKCSPSLTTSIPTVAQWRLSSLPRYLPAADVERVVAACDPSTAKGSRDQAVVLLMARLGLRAGDVVGLRLEDIDWPKATIRLLGKNRREAHLPLPQDTGDAILAYLERGRPRVASDRLFLRSIAPRRPFSNSSAVSKIVKRALARAGIDTPFRGAHVLRHSAATRMLQEGISLPEISIVLRHRSLESTAHYAKVDLCLLRQVVQPWPEVTSC